MKRTLLIGSLFTALLLASCAPKQPEMAVIVRNAPFSISLLSPTELTTGPSDMHFQVRHEGTIEDADASGRYLHIIVSSLNREDILHTVMPEHVGTGEYKVPHVFTESGAYRLWIEVDDATKELHHGEFADLIAYADLTISGNASTMAKNPIITEPKVTVDGYSLALKSNTFKVGTGVSIDLSVQDPKGKSVVLPMAESNIFVLIGPDFQFFRHGHMNVSEDSLHAYLPNTFPMQGRYVLWTEIPVFIGEELQTLGGQFALEVK